MNTTFTTCATKAKQILNLLQGYTKGIRITAILILLLMGVSNAWAATNTTVYYAVPTSVVGSYTVKCNVNYKGDGDDWQQHNMTKTDKTYDGCPIYSCTFTDKYNGLGCLQFQLYDGNTHKGQQQPISSWTEASTYNGKLLKHNQSGWNTYRYDQHGFEAANNGIKYYSNLNANDEEWNFNGQSAQTKELGEVTSLYLKEWFVQLYENWTGAQGNIKFQYNIHPTANSAGNYTEITKTWEDSGNWNNGWLYPKYGNNEQNINLLNGLPGSGKYTMSFKYYDSDLKLTSPVHKLNWTYNIVPSVNNFNVTASNVVSGTGTSGDPYVIAYGKTTTLTVSGNKASTDANSSLYAKFGSDNYTSTLEKGLTPKSTTQSIQVKAKYYNSKDNLSGTETATQTIYYRAQTFAVNITSSGNGTVTPSGTQQVGATDFNITANPSTGYDFKQWEITGGAKVANANSANTTITATATGTVTAHFSEIIRGITIAANNANYGTVSPTSVKAGVVTQSDKINATPKAGYEFVNWTAASGITLAYTTSTPTHVTKATASGKITANFQEIKHAITIQSNNNTFGTVNTSSASVGQHTAVSITATSEIGYVFKNWTATDGITITNANAASTTIKATQAGTVTANFEKAKTTTVYLKPNAAWKKDNARFAVYYWANGDKNAWSDMENIDRNNEYYSAEIPSNCTGFQFVRMNGSTSANNWDNDWNQTIDLKLPTNEKTMFDMNKGKVYLKPNSEWKSDGARFAAYFFSKNGETTTFEKWMSMFDAEDGTYYCEIPAEQPQSVIFCRMDPNNQTNDWGNNSVWNKTVDLQLVNADIFTIENAHFGDGNTGIATGSWNIIWTEPAYDITLHSSAFGEYGIVYNNTKYFSPKSGSVTYQIPIDATIKIFSTPYSNAYNGDVTVTKGGSTKDYASESTLTVDCNMTLDDNYKTIGTHVVYLAVPAGGIWIGANGTNCLRALHNLHNPATDIAAGEVVTMTEAGDAIIDGTSHTYYRCEIPAGYNTIRFEKRANAGTWTNTDLATKKLFYEIPLNSINCYRLSGTEDNFFIGLWEPAPGFDGDYRLLHVKEAGVSYPSDVIRAGTTEQTVSLHIYKKDAGSEFPKIELQKYNSGTKTWDIVTTQVVKDISKITANSEDGAVWNFVVKVNDGTASVDYENVERYTGDYYIRTNNAEGGWRNYTLSTNKMTFSSYAKAHSGYTHYFCRWIDIIDNSTEPGHNNNVKFIVANDYGAVISNEFAGDTHTTTGGLLPEDANVRWAWDEVTNTPSRAYILGAYGANAQQNKNIVVTYNTNTEEILDDQENWIYEIDLKDINQGSQLSTLQATYPSKNIQVTFKDAGVTKTETVTADQQIFASNLQMINADNDNHNTYTVRVMYDFKINKTLVMLLPDQGAKTGVDVFIERTDQGDATQVAAAVTRDEPGYTIYATMTFTKKHLESTTASEWERLYYWISFPFDVRISDVFGFGEYGKQWIIEYYDGAARAKNGYWLESDTYWKYISDTTYVAGKSNEDANGNPNNGVLVANKGYVLALARSIANQGLFKNGNEYVRLYFPSMNKIGSIDGDMQNVVTLLQEYPCTITGREAYDNNWHMIGVPSYADKNHTLTQDELIYYYEYRAQDNTYQVTTAQRRDPDISSSEAKSVTFKSMHSYMVQYAGTINWRNWATTPQQLAARRNTHSEQDAYSLRLELQRNGTYADQTFVQLKDESTTDYDMNIDLTKLMNSGTNIYTLAGEQRIQLAGSVIPVAETTIPVGVKVAAAGEYTLAMPDGTDGITALLIDYETNTTTDLLLSDYTVTLPKGSTENRFALIVKPRKTATRMENIGEGAKDADKYIIDGALYLQRDGKLYNAQGQIMR